MGDEIGSDAFCMFACVCKLGVDIAENRAAVKAAASLAIRFGIDLE
jgi:hypothetical protein